jgi:hypothetical protein
MNIQGVGHLLLLEHEAGTSLHSLDFLECIKQKKFGRTLLSVFAL